MADSATAEDIWNDSLALFGGQPVVPQGDDSDRIVCYGPLELMIPLKEGKANTLLADHLFSPALFLAERIERGLIPLQGKTVIELGAGCGLPSLLSATLCHPPRLVVVTDYPDDGILGNLRRNVERNRAVFEACGCVVLCRGYEWGESAEELIDMSSTFRQLPGCPDHPDTPTPGYDIVILSDLLHFHTSHGALIASLTSLMAKSPASRAYIAAGNYTSPHVCDNFLREGNRAGLTFEEGISPICANDGTNAEITDIDKWLGKMPVSGLDEQQLSMRKAMCRWWVGRWADDFCSGFLKV